MYQLSFYVPEDHLEPVKMALFAVGAGRIGDYDCCCWQCPGQGQFRPLDGSTPYLGEKGEIEHVAEYKVELVCEDALIEQAVEALKRSHPYEEPAYTVLRLTEL